MTKYLLFICSLVFLNSCENSATNSIPTTARNFPRQVSAIIQTNCLGANCHSQPTRLNDSLVLASWEGLLRGSRTVNDLIPYHARLSQLFLHVNTDPTVAQLAFPVMPLSRNPLSKEDQRVIFDWIEAGAPSADGQIPYAGATNRIYVVNQGADYVTQVDALTSRLIGAVKLPQGFAPTSIAFSEDKQHYYVASSTGNGIVKRFSTSGRVSDAEFESHLNPSEILLVPGRAKGYLANYHSTTPTRIGIFDPTTMTLTGYIDTNIIVGPRSFALTSNAAFVYVAAFQSDNILKIDVENDAIVGNLRMGNDVPSPVPESYTRKYGPHAIALSKDESKLFVSLVETQEIKVFDLTTDTVTATIPTQRFPYGIALTPDGTELWVANTGSNSISIIDAAGLQLLTVLDTIASQPQHFSFSPDGKHVYVACQGLKGSAHHTGGPPPSSLAIINRATRKLIATVELPTLSVAVATGF